MARKDLLAEAIADAKAVKETALANAKLALEEAFTPKLQSMISAKLAEEMDDEEMEETEEMAHEEEADEMAHEMAHEDETEEGYHEGAHEDETEEGYHEEETEEAYHEEEETEEAYHEEEEDDLDLESIIRELEMEGAHEDETEEGYHEEMDDDEMDDEDDEEIDLEEVINALKEMAHEDEVEEMGHEKEEGMHDENLEEELEEAYKTIESLQATINEVNLLNAKLLYTNKLFRTFELNESQKVKVLENFDRTSSVREVKLVFTTLAENLNVAKNKKTVVKEGYASKTIKSSAPKKEIITETNNLASRWKKLAGLK
jgi:hypothetical protein